MEELEQFRKEFTAHTSQDEANFAALNEKLDDIHVTLKDMASFMKNVNTGVGIFKFSWNNASKIGSFVLFLAALFLVVKYGIATAFTWLIKQTL